MSFDYFFFFNICLTALTIFILIYSYSLKFFPTEWRNKIKQDSLVGMAIIFSSMATLFCWIIYIYFIVFY